MQHRDLRLIGVVCFAAFVAACGGSDETPAGASGASGGGAGASGSGGASSGGASSGGAAGSGAAANGGVGAAAPCNTTTGYDGDELCIEAPDPADGFQLHYGPGADDAASRDPYLLSVGDEQTNCQYMTTPNDTEVYLSEYHARMRPGSHHMIVNAESSAHADGLGGCEFGGSERLLVGSSTLAKDFPDPGVVVPENAGLGLRLGPHTPISFQMHYINGKTDPILREAWVNFLYKDPDTVTTLVDPLFLVAGVATTIGAHTQHTTKGSCVAPKDLRVVEVHGHYHAHTVRMTIWKVSGADKTLVYESYDWHELASLQFDSGHQNPAPDPQARTAGGWNGLLELKQGDSLEWECEVNNDSDVALTFKNAVYTGEMCIVSGNYAPSFGGTWACEGA